LGFRLNVGVSLRLILSGTLIPADFVVSVKICTKYLQIQPSGRQVTSQRTAKWGCEKLWKAKVTEGIVSSVIGNIMPTRPPVNTL